MLKQIEVILKALKSLNVLVVDDEKKILDALCESLSIFFSAVYTASNGYDALKILKEKTIHTVLTDYEMPQMNGYELIAEIRSFNKKIPIAILSNHDDKDKLQKCIPLHLSAYLFKPITYQMIKDYLKELEKLFVENGWLEYKFSNTHHLNLESLILYENQNVHHLSKIEGSFIKFLIDLDGQVATFEKLYDEFDSFSQDNSALKNLVYRLKTKYKFTYIKNIKDIGYILVNDI